MGEVGSIDFFMDENPDLVFTDRDEPRALFWKRYDSLGKNQYYVLNYHGFGGIGKSRLCKYLLDILRDGTHPITGQKLSSKSILFSFEELGNACNKVSVLENLANKMETECGFEFPLFKYALYVYYRTKGHAADSPEISKIQDNIIGAFMFDAVSLVPVVGGIGSVLLKLVDSANAKIKTVIQKNSKIIQKLDMLSAEEIANELVRIFAMELYGATSKEAHPVVIFLDTYEQLQNYIYETSSSKVNDEWLWGARGIIRMVPNVLWVIAGQRKLDWDTHDVCWSDLDNIICQQITEISDDKLLYDMLYGIGITEDDILQVILEKSKGVPIHVSLCKETYFNIKNSGRTPVVADLDMEYSQLAARFIGGLSAQLKDIIEILACLEVWTDEDILRLQLSADSYYQIMKLSFIKQDKDYYTMHHSVQEVVYRMCSPLNKQKYYEYANQRLQDASCTLEQKKNQVCKLLQFDLDVAVAIADKDLKVEKILAVFDKYIPWIRDNRQDYEFFKKATQIIYARIEDEDLPKQWKKLLDIYTLYHTCKQGEYIKAKAVMRDNKLQIGQAELDPDTRGLLYYALALYATSENDTSGRIRYFQECLYLWKTTKDKKAIIDTSLKLAKSYKIDSRYQDAKEEMQNAIDLIGELTEEEYDLDVALCHGELLATMGDIELSVGTIDLCLQYLQEAENILLPYQEMQYDQLWFKLGIVYDNYRKLYKALDRPDMVMHYAKKDLEVCEEAYRLNSTPKNYRTIKISNFHLGENTEDLTERKQYMEKALLVAREIFEQQPTQYAFEEYIALYVDVANRMEPEHALPYLETAQQLQDNAKDFIVPWYRKRALQEAWYYYYLSTDVAQAKVVLTSFSEDLENQKTHLSRHGYSERKVALYTKEGKFNWKYDNNLYKAMNCFESQIFLIMEMMENNPSYHGGENLRNAYKCLVSIAREAKLYHKVIRYASKLMSILQSEMKTGASKKDISDYMFVCDHLAGTYKALGRIEDAKAQYENLYGVLQNAKIKELMYTDKIRECRAIHSWCSLLLKDQQHKAAMVLLDELQQDIQAYCETGAYQLLSEKQKAQMQCEGIAMSLKMQAVILYAMNMKLPIAWKLLCDAKKDAIYGWFEEDCDYLMDKIECVLLQEQTQPKRLSKEEGIRLLEV